MDEFWKWATTNTLGATIVGGLAVLIIWSLIGWIAKSRETPARWVVRFAKWAWSFRPVSSRRFELEAKLAKAAIARLSAERENAEKEHHKKVAAIVKDLERFSGMLPEQSERPRLNPWPVTSAAQQPPAPPLPDPRWSVSMVPNTQGKFQLVNSVPRSVAREVRIDGESDTTILDAGHWEDLSGPADGDFRASLGVASLRAGVNFDVTWYDESGNRRQEYVFLSSATMSQHVPF